MGAVPTYRVKQTYGQKCVVKGKLFWGVGGRTLSDVCEELLSKIGRFDGLCQMVIMMYVAAGNMIEAERAKSFLKHCKQYREAGHDPCQRLKVSDALASTELCRRRWKKSERSALIVLVKWSLKRARIVSVRFER
jgi:hypothetical protein